MAGLGVGPEGDQTGTVSVTRKERPDLDKAPVCDSCSVVKCPLADEAMC